MYMLPSSLHPPSHGDGAADAANVPWVLLDLRAYFADRRNSTTAACNTRDRGQILVTFFPAQPPRVSHLCVYCPSVEAREFAFEPRVLATDGKFVLLRLAITAPEGLYFPTYYEYYIYKASSPPSLLLLPPNPYLFYDNQAGLLSRGDEFTVVALHDDLSAYHRGTSIPGVYDTCLLKSEENIWTLKSVLVPSDEQQCSNGDEVFAHENSKVLTIGGEAGTLASVDLWRGILLFDVLSFSTTLRYIKLPPELMTRKWGYESPQYTRDIVFGSGHFRFVEFLSKHCKVSFIVFGTDHHYMNDGWIASMWKKEATSSQENPWCHISRLESKNISFDHNPLLLKSLPKLPGDEMVLERLHTDHPTLSLQDDGILYLMTKVNLQDSKALVIAVDITDGKLQEVVEIYAERTVAITLTYTQSKISDIHTALLAPGTKGELNRSGTPLMRSCPKKQH